MKIKLHRGAAVFALLWAFAALLPPVRETAHTMTSLWRGEKFYTIGEPLLQSSNDPISIEWNLEREAPDRLQMQKWDALIARYPDQTWIAAARLRASLSGVPWWRGSLLASLKSGNVQKRRNFEGAAALAMREGQKEPANAYWPWMEAGFRFVLGQKAQAMTAMERGGRASFLQDYNQSSLRARIHWLDQHAHPTWEERLGLSYSVLSSDSSFMSVAVGEAALEAGHARSQGDDKAAIRIGASLLRVGEIWRRDSDSYYGALVAQNMGYTVLERVFNQKIHMNSLYETRLLEQRGLRQRWGAFARTNGRGDVAHYADWLRDDININSGRYMGELWQQFGLVAPWGHIAALAPVFLTGVFCACLAFALLWFAGRLWGRRAESDGPTRGQIALCANFSLWSLTGAALLLGQALLGSRTGGLDLVLSPFVGGDNTTSLPILSCVTIVLGCWLLPVTFVNWKRGRRFQWVYPEHKATGVPRRFGWWRAGAWLFFFFFAAIVASDGNAMWDDTIFQMPVSATLATFGLSVALALEIVRYRRTGRFLPRLRIEGTPLASPIPRVWRWMRNGAFLVSLSSLLGFWMTSESWVTASPLVLACLALGVLGAVATVALAIKTGWRDSFFVEVAWKSAGVLSLVCSVAFILLALGAWPLRTELNRQLDRRLTVKEVDWMQEQIAKNPSPSS